MRRLVSILMALLMILLSAAATAEEATDEPSADDNTYVPLSTLDVALLGRPVSEEPTHVNVANSTRVSGGFFTDLWSNNTSDIDVRTLVHGYNTAVWNSQAEFIADPEVVQEVTTATVRRNTVYTVHLQEDLTYSDGTPITAADYVFSYLLYASPAVRELGGNASRYAQVVGFDAYHDGNVDTLEGVRLVDDYTYTVTIQGDYEPYFYSMADIWCQPYPITVLAPGCAVEDTKSGVRLIASDEGAENVPFSAEVLRQTIFDPDTGYETHPALTCGPYLLTGYDPATGQVDFALNPAYKGNYEGVKPVIDTLTLTHVAPDAMADALRSGEVDLLNKAVDKTLLTECMAMVTNEGISMQSYARIGYGFCAFACEKGPQQFQAVRQAIAYAVDADAFNTEYLGGFGLPVYGYYGIGQWMTIAAMGAIRPEVTSAADEVKWDAMTLDELNHYDQDLTAAVALLEADGWTLNEQGEPFDPAVDTVRCKQVGDELMPLAMTFARTAGHEGAALLTQQLEEAAPALGLALTVTDMTYTELLAAYYSKGERNFDMALMATNFLAAFDPYHTFAFDGDTVDSANMSAVKDQELMALALELRRTEPMDYLTYEGKWLAFQARFNEVLPTLPLYSNIYFDFFTPWLQNYQPSAYYSWPVAILYAYYGEPAPEPAPEDEFSGGDDAEDEFFEDDDTAGDDDEVIFMD